MPTLDHNPAAPPVQPMLASGSRRRRLWELPSHSHCPVTGCCLPIAALRRVIDRAAGSQARLDDYELHCAAVTECKRRGPVAEALNKELDRRFMLQLRSAASPVAYCSRTAENRPSNSGSASCSSVSGTTGSQTRIEAMGSVDARGHGGREPNTPVNRPGIRGGSAPPGGLAQSRP